MDEYPNECCGIILEDEKNKYDAYRCQNVSNNKNNNFEIDAKSYLGASKRGKIIGYYHSHPNNNRDFSTLDKEVSKAHGLPLIMHFLKENKFYIYNHE